jgi:hypothetical protein
MYTPSLEVLENRQLPTGLLLSSFAQVPLAAPAFTTPIVQHVTAPAAAAALHPALDVHLSADELGTHVGISLNAQGGVIENPITLRPVRTDLSVTVTVAGDVASGHSQLDLNAQEKEAADGHQLVVLQTAAGTQVSAPASVAQQPRSQTATSGARELVPPATSSHGQVDSVSENNAHAFNGNSGPQSDLLKAAAGTANERAPGLRAPTESGLLVGGFSLPTRTAEDSGSALAPSSPADSFSALPEPWDNLAVPKPPEQRITSGSAAEEVDGQDPPLLAHDRISGLAQIDLAALDQVMGEFRAHIEALQQQLSGALAGWQPLLLGLLAAGAAVELHRRCRRGVNPASAAEPGTAALLPLRVD